MPRTEKDYQRIMDRYAKHYPRFSEGEYARRYDMIRRMMVERNISGLIIHGDSMKSNRMQANVRYVTNFVDEVVSYVFFPLEGEPTQWMDIRPHLPNAKAVEVIKDIRSRRSALSHVGDQASELVERIKQARLENTKLGIVGYQLMHELPYDIMEALKRGLPNATFENVTEVYDEIQMYHSTEEVEFMKKAARLTDIAAEGMVKSDCGKLSGFLL